MSYYNFHAIALKLIKEGHCISATEFEEYHNIKPALVLYFDNHRPIPIREYMWSNYSLLLKENNIKINKI